MKLCLHAKKLLSFALKHPAYRYAGPFSHNLRNILGSDSLCDDRVLYRSLTRGKLIYLLLRLGHLAITDLRNLSIVASPLGIMSLDLIILHHLSLPLEIRKDAFLLVPAPAQIVTLRIQGLEFLLDLIHLERYAFTLDGLTLDLELTDPAVKFSYRLRHGIHFQTQLGSRLVNEVDGLVRKETACDVTMRQLHSCNQCIILDTYLMVVLVTFLETAHDGDGSRWGRLVYSHHLETTLKGLVCLKILLIFVKCSRADGPELSTGKRRLEDIGSIHGS